MTGFSGFWNLSLKYQKFKVTFNLTSKFDLQLVSLSEIIVVAMAVKEDKFIKIQIIKWQ